MPIAVLSLTIACKSMIALVWVVATATRARRPGEGRGRAAIS